jgi:hypothetical protein
MSSSVESEQLVDASSSPDRGTTHLESHKQSAVKMHEEDTANMISMQKNKIDNRILWPFVLKCW